MKWCDCAGATRCTKLLLLASLFIILTSSVAFAQAPYQRLVQRIESADLGYSNPAGLVFSPGGISLFAAPSPDADGLSSVAFSPDLTEAIAEATTQVDPVNIAFDRRFNSLLFWDAGANQLVEIKIGQWQSIEEALTRTDGQILGLSGVRGLTVDPMTGDLFALVVSSKPVVTRIVRLVRNSLGAFDGLAVSSVVLSELRNEELHGIAFNPSNDHLYALAPATETLYEMTLEGQVLSERDIASFGLRETQNMIFAHSADPTDDPEIMNLYILEGGGDTFESSQDPVSSGQFELYAAAAPAGSEIVEVSLTQPDVLDLSSVTQQPTHIQTVETSLWSPPSPDAGGIAYVSSTGNLLISDSEVNEMPIFTGINLWESTLSGAQVQEFSTISFSDEPSGVAYNPNNGHLFFTDDTGDRAVYELDPGPDGLYGTGDDISTWFDTDLFSCHDPEGITYDTFQGHLFIADGSGAEIFELDPGPNGIFDGVAPSGDDIVSQFDTSVFGLNDPEGVEFNPDAGTLFIVSRDDGVVVETTTDGTVIRVIDVTFLNSHKLAGIAYGPTSTNPFERSLYIVDRGTDNNSDPNENDGKLYEVGIGSATPSLTIDDVAVIEGDNGTVDAIFTVTLSSPSSQTVTVDYATSNGSATTADNDYDATSGQLSFASLEISKQITVTVNSDPAVEDDEIFFVNLSNATVAGIGDSQGTATITDDDGPDPVNVSFKDGVNGYSGTRDASMRADSSTTNFGSDTDIALDGSPDESGLLYWDLTSIPPGSSVEAVQIAVNITNKSSGGYELYELKRDWVEDEATWNQYASGQSWEVAGADGPLDRGSTALGAIVGNIEGPSTISLNSTGIAVVQGWIDNPSSNHGFVIQDYINHSNGLGFSSRESAPSLRPELIVTLAGSSEPALVIDDVAVVEGDAGTVNAIFTVTLTVSSEQTVTVDYATSDGTATAGVDYVPTSGQVSFLPGETTQTITVMVYGDLDEELSETFFVDLSNAVNAPLADTQGAGTISDDDSLLPGEPITFSVSGDYPYDSGELPVLQEDMDFHNLYSPSEFYVHVGDIIGSSESCFAQRYVDVANSFKTLAVPAFIIPGDNEWTDCSDPAQGWQWWEGSFTNFEQNYCRPPAVDHQSVRNENWAFVSKGVLFIGINIPDGSISTSEEIARLQDNADWVDFHLQDKADQVRAAVVFGHAGPSTERDLFFNQFEASSVTFNKPVFYIMGDDHAWTLDNPWSAPNMQRLTVNKGGDEDPPQITVTMDQNNPFDIVRNPWSNNPPILNAQPCVDAGVDQMTTEFQPLNLSAIATDDGVPTSPGSLTTTWSKLSGPGDVVFGDANTLSTTADFDSEGLYNLQLTASDGQLITTDEVTVDVGAWLGPALSISNASVNEAAGSIDFTVTMAQVSSQTVTVDYTTADSTALEGSDYTATVGTLTIPVDSISGLVSVPILDDASFESFEVFKLVLSNPVNSTIADGTGVGTITDDDAPSGEGVFTESGGLLVMEAEHFTDNVTRNGQTWTQATTYAGYEGLGAMAALPDNGSNYSSGYESTSPYMNFLADFSTTGTYYVWVRVRAVSQGNTLHVGLNETATPSAQRMESSDFSNWAWINTSSSGTASLEIGSAGTQSVTVWMREDGIHLDRILLTTDAGYTPNGGGPPESSQGEPVLALGDLVVTEGVGGTNAVFAVTMSSVSSQAVTVDYTTADSTALAGLDYTASSGTLTIPVDSTMGVISIPILDDVISELPEVFKLQLSNASGATLTDSLGLGTITDNEPLPSLSINDTTVDETAGTMAFTVTMSGLSSQAVSVDYVTSDSTALAGPDYTATSGTLTIPVDSISGVITVSLLDDLLSEGSEVFKLHLSNPVGGTLADSLGLGTIADDEALPTLTIADGTADEAAGTLNFTVTMSTVSGQPVTVNYATADSTTLAGIDYTIVTDTLIIPVDSISGIISVPIVDDSLSESNEILKVLLSNATRSVLSDSIGLGTIIDNDALPTLSVADTTVDESAGSLSFTLSLSAVSGQVVSVDYTTADSTALAEIDYAATSGTLVIPVDSTTGVITIPVTEDLLSESSEFLTLQLSNLVGAAFEDSLGLGTIIDNDALPTLSVADTTVDESAGTIDFAVALSAPSGQIITFDYVTSDSTALAGSDYTLTTGTLTIPVDSTIGIVSVPITDDVISESSELFKLQLSNASAATFVDSLALGTIADNEALPTLSVNDVSADESAGTIDFTVTMSGLSGQAVTVDYTTSDSTALAGSDYAATSGTLTIPVDSTSGIITIAITDDLVSEASELFKLQLSAPSGATVVDSFGLGTITDNEALPTLTIADTTVDESAGTLAFTVTMSGLSGQAVTVDYATSDSTALAGSDYAVTSGTLTIPADSTSGTITVGITDDLISEGSEFFKLDLSNASGATLVDSLGVGTIADNESTPTLSVNDVSADESAGTIDFTVTMSGLSGQAVTVDYATADSTALAGLDYAATSGTLTILADSTSGTITVAITDDAISEASELFKLDLSNASGATLVDSLGLGTITDNEAAPTLSVNDATVDESAGAIDFTVTMSGLSGQAVTVDYATADSSALAGSDYAATSGTLTIPADSTSGTITVAITDDLVSEGSELFKLQLSAPSGATLVDSLGLGTIVDNESVPTLSINDVSADESAGTIDFTVTMSGLSGQAVTVDYATSDSTALAGSDYMATSGTLTIPADSTSGTITVAVTDDAISESSEFFKLQLSNASAATLVDSLALGTITDNEALPTLSVNDVSADESAGTMAFTVTMSGLSGQAVTVDYTTSDSTALAGSDYAATSGTLTIPADSTTGTITVAVTDDAISEASELFKLQLSSASGATLVDSLGLGTIADNEAVPTLSINDVSADESAGTVNFTVTMSGLSGQAVTVDYSTADSTALAGSDYTATSGTLTIPADSTSGTITVAITDDVISEGSELFKLDLSNASGATLVDSLGLGTIADNESVPTLSVNDVSADESAGTIDFTVTMSGPSGQAVTVDYATSDSTALAGSDYAVTSGTLTIPADSTTGTITVAITDDLVSEGSELFKLELNNASGATLVDSLGLGTIADNESAPTLSVNDATVDESAGTMAFTVTMSGLSGQAVTVDYATSDSTALASSDYTAASGTLTIPADSTTGTITVAITDDLVSEASELFKLELSAPSGATLVDSLGLGTIADNEAVPTLSVNDVSADESAGTIDFTVTMSGASGQAVTVDYTTSDSTALAGSDYAATTGTLTIPADSTTGTITVPITDDLVSEGSELFKLQLSSASGTTLVDSLGLGTITDNEALPTLSVNDVSSDESAGTMAFTVTMSGASGQAVTVDYATSDSTALAGSDYAATSGTLTIPADSTSGTITVAITDDLVSEGSELFKLGLSNASGATLVDSLGLGTIADNESAPTLSVNDVSADESAGTIDFTVTMSGLSGQAVTVDYATSDSTALAGSDYAATSGALTIPADSTSGTITVAITDDAISEASELFKLELSNASGATLVDSLGLGTIADNEAAPTLSVNDVSADESAGTIDFTVTMSGPNGQAVTVDYATSDSTALAGSDYVATSGTLTIPADSTLGTITVAITDDAISEASEFFKLDLSGATGATLTDSLGLGTIADNESAPTLSINDVSADESADSLSFTVTMSGLSGQAVTVDYATSDSTALAGSDYAAASGTLTIPADSTTGTITVAIWDDLVSEGSELFKLQLSAPSGATLVDSLGLGTIADNEAAPTLSVNDVSADESAGTIDFTVTMPGLSGQAVTVDYATSDSTALAGSDYAATSGTLTIPVDSTTGTITVAITDDLISEGSELFKLELSNASGATLVDSLGLGTVADNESAPTLSVNNVSADESTGTIDFTVTMSGASGQAVTVDYATGDSTALAGSDYEAASGTLTIPADSTTGTISVPITDDLVSEATELFKLELSSASGAILVDSLGLGTITDNEALPTLSVNDVNADESAGTMAFTVTMSGLSGQAVTVDYATSDSTAQAGSDYAATSGTLTIPADSTSGTITVAITDDLLSEASELFKLQLSSASGATLTDSLGLGTIADNESAPTLSVNDATVDESAGTMAFTVTMSGLSGQAVTVDYATVDSTALAGSDYTATSGTLTIPADSTSGTITVAITDDAISEASELFKLQLSSASGATLVDSLALGTITDNEALPTLSVNDVSSDESAGTMAFTVTMSGASGQAVTVDYATSDSTALAGSDYTATSGTLTIPADSTSGTITVAVTDDAISEASEFFKLELSNASGATLVDSLGLGAIADNESAPTLSVNDVSSDESAGTMAFTVTMSGLSGQTVTVDYATADSTALAGSDYTATTGTLTIPADSTTGTITVVITDDLVSEAAELFKLQLSSASGATLVDSLGLGTIADNESAPTLSVNDATVDESAGTMAFTVTMSGASGQAVTVDYATSDSTALAGSDYAATSGTLTIPADSTTGTITVAITDDVISEASELFKLELSAPTGATLVDSLGLGTITDNESAPTLSINDVSADESAGTMAFTVTMSGASGQAVTVDYATSDSTALAGSDYEAVSGTLTIPADSTSGTITVAITDDLVSEASELFKLELSAPTGATLVDSLGLGTIADNESAPTLSINDVSADESAGTMAFTVTMSGASGQAVTVDYATSDSTAQAGSDYAATSGTLTIPADSTSSTITVAITDDVISEASELFKLQLSNASGATLVDSLGLGTIADNESAPTLSINDVSADESAGTMAFTVTMSGASGQAVTVDYATSDSTAQAGSDYAATSGTLTIPADSTTGTITVAVTDDAISEASELFKLQLSSASGATLVDSLGLGTIADNEAAPTLSVNDVGADESAGTMAFTVTMSGLSAQAVAVDYTTADSTALAGSDYAAASGTLTIPADSTTGTITVAITDDLVSEASELFKLQLSAPSGATLVDSLGLGTIADNEAAPTLSVNDVSADESAGTLAFTVTMSGASGQAVTVDYATADSTALAGSDYAATSGTLTIPADSTTGTITVAIMDDAISEASEFFKLQLSNASGATLVDSLGLGTIADNESAPTLSVNDVSADESADSLSFTVTMSGVSAQAVTVDYATADSTALAGSDYAATSGTLTIPADSTSGIITVAITDDAISEASELFKLQLSNASGATLVDSLGLGTITDNESAPTLSINDVSADESADSLSFTVTMSGVSAQAVTVDYATADSTALAGSDYAATSGTLTIPADSTSGIITVAITDDVISEASELFKLQLSNASGATLVDSLGLGTIADNESAPTLSINDVSADESAGTLAFTVTMSGASAQAVAVDYATSDSTALAGSDYAATSGTLTIPADSTSGTITVAITDDAISEASEFFKLELSGATGATLTDSLGLGTIADNESAPTLSINDVSADESADSLSFTVTMSGASGQAVTVDYATSDSTALGGSDYTAASGNLTIPADSTTGTITVAITDDLVSEGNELFILQLSAPTGATLVDSLGLGTIADDEAAPTLSVNDVSADESAGTLAFTVTMSGASGQAVTVDYATGDSTALAGSDYEAVSGTLTIPADSTTGIISIPITDDLVSEGSELFKLQLSSASGASLVDSLGLGTIADNEAAPTLSVNDVSADESAGTLAFTVTMSGASGQSVTVDYATSDSTALAGSDYAATSGTLTIPADSTTGTITVPITDDLVSEGSELFKLELSAPSGATLVDSLGHGTIADNESAPTLSINDVSVDESAGTMAFMVTMSGASGQAVTVDYATSDSTAQAGSDYAATSGTLTIPVDSTTGTITVAITDDLISEASELFKLQLSNASGATLVDSLGLGTIADNESAPTLSINDVSADESGGTMAFTVTMSGASAQVVTVDYSTADSTAQAGSDYAATSGTLTIPVDSTSGVITVPIIDDGSNEASELFKVVLSNTSGATLVDSLGLGTITDNESAPTLSVNDVSADESAGTLVFTVTMSAASSQAVTVDYATSDSTASAGSDYTATSGTLTIPADSTSGAITVSITDDASAESSEVFKLELSNPSGATIADGLGLGTITDDDSGGGEPVTVYFRDGVDGYSGTRDVELASNLPATNFGSDTVLKLDGTPSRSVLVAWDVSSIPTGSTVQSVTITFNITNATSDTYEFYELLQPWLEGEATWEEYAAGQSWQAAGASGSSDRGSTMLGTITGPKGLTTVTLNAAGVAVVQSWVDDGATNQGLVIRDHLGADNELDLSSHENNSAWKRPMLTVTYTGQGGTTSSKAKTGLPELVMETLPEVLALSPNYPNPFSQETNIEYALPEPASVRLMIYNIRGQLVSTLVDERQEAGYKRIRWNGTDDTGRAVGSGVYLLRMMVDQRQFTGKMILMR